MKAGAGKRPNLLAGEDLPANPRQKRSIEKRERLKTAGLALFAEKRFEGASIEDIASRARLAVGGFYQHFRSKRRLLLVLMDELLEKLSRLDLRPQGMSDPRSSLRALLKGAFSHDLHYLGPAAPGRKPPFPIKTWRRNSGRFALGPPRGSQQYSDFSSSFLAREATLISVVLLTRWTLFSGPSWPKPSICPKHNCNAKLIPQPT